MGITLVANGVGTGMAAPGSACTYQGWVGVWAAAPSDASRGIGIDDEYSFDLYDASRNPKSAAINDTTRAILTPSFGGSTVRIRLSNRFGTVPVTFASSTIARLGGSRSVTAAPGDDVVSDPVEFPFDAVTSLAVPTDHTDPIAVLR